MHNKHTSNTAALLLECITLATKKVPEKDNNLQMSDHDGPLNLATHTCSMQREAKSLKLKSTCHNGPPTSRPIAHATLHGVIAER